MILRGGGGGASCGPQLRSSWGLVLWGPAGDLTCSMVLNVRPYAISDSRVEKSSGFDVRTRWYANLLLTAMVSHSFFEFKLHRTVQ